MNKEYLEELKSRREYYFGRYDYHRGLLEVLEEEVGKREGCFTKIKVELEREVVQTIEEIICDLNNKINEMA